MILVGGATGTVGRELVHQLVDAGHAVRGLSREPANAALPVSVEVMAADTSDPRTLPPVLEGVDRAFLLVNMPGDRAQASNWADALRGSGVEHVVLMTSLTVESPVPGETITEWQRENEQIIRDLGIPWTFIRPGQFMANTRAWIPTIKADNTVYGWPGNHPSAIVHEGDIAAVAAAALTTPGHEQQAYPVLGPEMITQSEQVAVLGAAIGRDLAFVEMSHDAAIDLLTPMLGDRVAAAALLEAMAGPDAPWRRPIPLLEKLTGRRERTYAEWAAQHAAEFV